MPIYEYHCPDCENRREVLHMSHDALQIEKEIPYCDLCQVRYIRAMSMCTFNLRGRGWARDGYSNKLTPQNNPANKGNPAAVASDMADIAEHRAKH